MPLKNRLPGLDLLRASAISLVLVYHVKAFFLHPQALDGWSSFGWTGVDLFFVLSGFLITAQLLEAQETSGIDLRSYFIKRACRILPAYWLMVAIYFLLPSWREIQSPAPLWKFLTFTQNLGLDTVSNRSFSHAWSLCIEEQFYLALPLLLIAAGRRPRLRTLLLWVIALMSAGILVRFASWQIFVAPHLPANLSGPAPWTKEWGTWIYYPTQSRLDGLLTGVLIAAVFHTRPTWRTWCGEHPFLFLIVGAAGLLLGWRLGTPMTREACAIIGYPVISLAYGSILIAATSPSVRLPKPAAPGIAWLATLSYVIYLSHKVAGHKIQGLLLQAGMEGTGWPMFACLMAGFVAIGFALHLLIEKPAFKIRDRLLRTLKQGQRRHEHQVAAGHPKRDLSKVEQP